MEASPEFSARHGSFVGSRLLQTQPDGVLCRLALRGNSGAYETLYNRHHGALYGFVYHLLGRGATAEDAEDIAQESFSTAFGKLADRRDDASFKSWLFTIARNRTYDQIRVRRPQMADVTELPIAADGGPEDQAESKAQMAWLVTALGELPDRQREALVMREMGGLSYSEIATGMDTTVPSVKQLINRARGSLSAAADGTELRPRRLRKELAGLVPVIPLAVTSAGVAAFGVAGTTAGVTAGASGFSAATKIAAVVIAAAAIGGAAELSGSASGGAGMRDTVGPVAAGDATSQVDPADRGGDRSGGGGGDHGAGRGDGSGDGGRHRSADDGSNGGRNGGSDDSSPSRGERDSGDSGRRGSSRSDSGDGSGDQSGEAEGDRSGSGSDSADNSSDSSESSNPGEDNSGSGGGSDSGSDSGSGSGSGSGEAGTESSGSSSDLLTVEDH